MEKHFVRIIKPCRGVERAFVRVEHTNTMVWLHQPPLLANTFMGKDNAGIRQRQRAEEEKSDRERTVLWGDGWFIKLCYYYLFISRLFAGHVGARWLGLREGKVKP